MSLAKEAARGDTSLPLRIKVGHTKCRHWPGVGRNSRGPKSIPDMCLFFILSMYTIAGRARSLPPRACVFALCMDFLIIHSPRKCGIFLYFNDVGSHCRGMTRMQMRQNSMIYIWVIAQPGVETNLPDCYDNHVRQLCVLVFLINTADAPS